MSELNRQEGESIFLSLAPGSDPGITLGELFDRGAIEIKVTQIADHTVTLSIAAPEIINVIGAELVGKSHGTDFPPHEPIQGGD